MKMSKGFSLLEILMVLTILGIFVALSVPTIVASIEQTRAQTAQNNLLAILAAQSKFHEDYSTSTSSVYCLSTGTNPTGKTALCANNLANINVNLQLNASTSDLFTYSCTNATSPYQCTASDGKDTLVLNPNAVIPSSYLSCYGTSAPVANFSNCPISCVSSGKNNCPYNLQ